MTYKITIQQADGYEKLREDVVYRRARSPQRALAHVLRVRGHTYSQRRGVIADALRLSDSDIPIVFMGVGSYGRTRWAWVGDGMTAGRDIA